MAFVIRDEGADHIIRGVSIELCETFENTITVNFFRVNRADASYLTGGTAAFENHFRNSINRGYLMRFIKFYRQTRNLGISKYAVNIGANPINKCFVNLVMFILKMKYFKGYLIETQMRADTKDLYFKLFGIHQVFFCNFIIKFINNMRMKSFNRFLPLTILSVLFLSACTKEEVFPPEPAITFISFTKMESATPIDDQGVLKIFFTDGDGDLGLDESDSMSPFDKNSIYYYNYFIKYFEKQHGTFVAVELPVSFNSRIPRLESQGNSPSIKGEIELEVGFNNPFSAFDTIRFEVSVCDRALHMSNVITTPEIIVKKH
jgi:hypothetical protein